MQKKLKLNPDKPERILVWKADVPEGLDPLVLGGVEFIFAEHVRSLALLMDSCFKKKVGAVAFGSPTVSFKLI